VLPAELVSLAIEVAEEGLAAGELPIGDVLGRSWTRERAAGRRLVHADLLAMEQADRALGWSKRTAPLQLAVNLEPCLMCVGAAMALVVDEICYGLESPASGFRTWAERLARPPG
jgi:tRNA(adenine34) deaminase